MQEEQLPDRPDPAEQLQREVYLQTVDTLRRAMPPPLDASPETLLRSHRVAIAKVAAMVPASAQEADLAANAVAASTHAADCLRLAVAHASDLKLAGQLRAQAASMGRESRGYCTALLRMQAARQKRESNDKTCDSATWAEHISLGLMKKALDILPELPLPATEPDRPPGAPPESPLAAVAERPPATTPEPPLTAEPEQPPPPPLPPEEAAPREHFARKASYYAVVHTMQAQRIRKHRGMPPDANFEAPEPELLDAIIHGNGSNLRWCDEYVPWVPKGGAPT
jgi:hypothetical protein